MSNTLFNLGPTNRHVSHHIFQDSQNNRRYRLIEPIGYWDYNNNTTLYKGSLCPPRDRPFLFNPRGAVVNIKACNKILEPQWYELARDDAARSTRIRHPNILPILGSFDDGSANDIFFLVLPEAQCISLRSLMFSLEIFSSSGLPEDCIVIALQSALRGLDYIHSNGEIHRQITGCNIVVYKIPHAIRLGFAGSAQIRTEFTHRPDPFYDGASSSRYVPGSEYLPYRDILKWGRAPEVVEDDQERYKTSGHTDRSDIWLIGITALEFAYGDVRVLNREQLLDIAKCISVTRRMANTWEVLVQQTEEFKIESQKPPKGKGKKIQEATMNFLTRRLQKIANSAKGKKKVVETQAIVRRSKGKEEVVETEAIVRRNKGKEKVGETEPKGKEKVGEIHKEPFSERFVKLVAKCLNENPVKRPSAKKLLKCKLLRNVKDVRYLKDVVMYPSPLMSNSTHER